MDVSSEKCLIVQNDIIQLYLEKRALNICVKRDVTTDHEGEVSTILHDELNEGDKINLSHL